MAILEKTSKNTAIWSWPSAGLVKASGLLTVTCAGHHRRVWRLCAAAGWHMLTSASCRFVQKIKMVYPKLQFDAMFMIILEWGSKPSNFKVQYLGQNPGYLSRFYSDPRLNRQPCGLCTQCHWVSCPQRHHLECGTSAPPSSWRYNHPFFTMGPMAPWDWWVSKSLLGIRRILLAPPTIIIHNPP